MNKCIVFFECEYLNGLNFIKNAKKLNVIPDSVDNEGLKAAYIEADKHR